MHPLRTLTFVVITWGLAAGCGGSGGDRPTEAEISTSLQGDQSLLGPLKVDETAADCLAEVLAASELTDESLRALVDGDQTYESADEDEIDILQDLVGDISACTETS